MITLLKFSSDIYEDDYQDGEGECTGCGYPVTPIGEQFNTLKDAIAWFGDNYGYSTAQSDYEREGNKLYTSQMCSDKTEYQNGGWLQPTEGEITLWKQGKQKLYVENVVIYVSE